MNIFLRELRANLKSFLIWSATMVFIIAAGMMKYSAFQKTGDSINDMFKDMPEGVLSVIGMAGDLDLTSVGVFYSIFFLYFLLLMSVHSAMLGTTIISKEERDKTADFLVVKPIRRYQIVTPKLLASFFYVFMYNMVTFISSAIIVEQFNTTGESLTIPILYMTSALFFVQVLFLGVGLFFGAVAKSSERASGMATAVILSTFLLKVFIDLKPEWDYLDAFTPFRYFNSHDVMFNREIPMNTVALCIAVAVAGMIGTYYFFQKRDMRS